MATHSSILAWRIPWTEEPGGLQSMGSQSQVRPKHTVGSPCSSRGSKESSPAPQLEGISPLALSLLCGPTLSRT